MFDRKTNTFTAIDGTEIKLKRIRAFKIQILTNQIRDKYIENGEPLDPPHFYVDIVGGKQQRHYHTEKTIYEDIDKRLYKDDLEDETKDAWERHIEAVARYEDEIASSNLNLLFQDGTEFEVPESDWIAEQEDLKIEIPKNHKARKAHYLLTEVLELEEAMELGKLIMEISQKKMNEQFKEAESISESFRDPVEES